MLFTYSVQLCDGEYEEHEEKEERTGLALAERLVEAIRPDVLLLLRAAAGLCRRL